MSRMVVVTGGAKGIGRAVSERFSGLGDEVVALGRDRAALQRAEEELSIRTFTCDVTAEDAVRTTFGEIGPVDVLVNNAGIAESGPLAKTTLAAWARHFDTNVTGPFLCMREVVSGMRERGAGVIVTVASTAGRIGVPYTSAYTASKHAAVGLTRAVASELAGTGVRVNAVCPAFVNTALTERAIRRIVEATGRTEDETEHILAAQSPLGRLLDPREVAEVVAFLASPAASTINGQALVIDGGRVQA